VTGAEDPLFRALQTRIDELEEEIKKLRGSVHGRTEYGWVGLMGKASALEHELGGLKEMIEAFEEREKERTWQTERNARFQKFAISGVLAILVPLAVQAIGAVLGV
jgi:uncharacterized protein YPO0396